MKSLVLLYPSWCRLRRAVSGSGLSAQVKGRNTILLLGLLWFLVLLFFGTQWLLRQMARYAILNSLIPDVVLDFFLLAMVGVGFVSNLASCLGSFFFAEDLELVLASPLKATRFYFGRLATVWINCSWMPLIFCIPVITAVGLHTGAPLQFYAVAVVIIPGLLAFPTTFASIIALPIALILPRLAVRGTKVLLATFIGVILYLCFHMAPSLLSEATSADRIARIIYYITLPDARFLPIRWASTILSGLALGTPVPFGGYALLIIAALAATSSLSFLLYSIFHSRAYAITKTASNLSEASFSLPRGAEAALPFASPRSRAIIMAEVGAIIREWSSLFELSLLFMIGTAYLYNIRLYGVTSYFEGNERAKWQQILLAMNCLTGSFFGIACATRLIFPSVSRDGRSAWLLYTSPISIQQVLATKFRFWFVLLALIVASFLGLSTYLATSSLKLTFLSIAFGCIVSYGITGIAIGLGGEHANFSWEHISQLAASFGSFICMITTLAYVIASGCILSLVIVGISPMGGRLPASPMVQVSAMLIGLGIIGIASSKLTRLCLSRAHRHLSQDIR